MNSPKVQKEIQKLTQKMLVQTVSIKLAHDAIISKVDESRKKIQANQDELLDARQHVENLSYEKRMLQREIADCKSEQGTNLSRLKLSLPPQTGDTAAHKKLMSLLDEERNRRKSTHNEVQKVIEETRVKRKRLCETRVALRGLPHVVKSLTTAMEPVKALLNIDGTGVGSAGELSQVQKLPAPLYVLAREALVYREVNPGRIGVAILGEAVCDQTSFQEMSKVDVYCSYPMQVQIDVIGEGGAEVLRIWFRYHVVLEVVSVKCAMLLDGKEVASFPLKELQMLYPLDFGEESPNASNAYLENEQFKFDQARAKGWRPYIWANLICGIACLKSVKVVGGKISKDVFEVSKWPETAAGQALHIRFKDVMETLQGRLRAVVSLKKQIENLLRNQLVVTPAEMGLGKEVEAQLKDFEKLARQDWAAFSGLGRTGTDGKYTEVWSMTVVKGKVEIKCIMGLEPDYPVGPPTFRMVCEKGGGLVTEKDMLDLERCVNEVEMKGKGKEELLMGGQITALLTYVDRLVAGSASMDEGVVDSGMGEVKGRTRSKRDIMLCNKN